MIALALGVVVLTRDLGAGDVPPAVSSTGGPLAVDRSVGPVASLGAFCGGVQEMALAHAAQMSAPGDANAAALARAANRLESLGVPAATPAAAVEGVRMMIEDARRTERGASARTRSEAENLAYERLGEFLTESCGVG